MLLRVINFFRGILKIRIKGSYIPRFLNVCLKNDIPLWDIQRESVDVVYARLHIKDFRRLARLGTKTRCRVHIVSKTGGPFIAKRFSKRYGLMLGGIFFCVLLYITGAYIWDVEVTGTESLRPQEIIGTLQDAGVGIGTRASEIDVRVLQNEMLLRMPKLSYIGINVSGNRLDIQVKERREKPPIFDAAARINIVSDKTALIEEMNVKAGQARKKAGQTVLKGEVLVSSLVESEAEGGVPRSVHALADIKARTWQSGRRVLPLNTPKKEYTGRRKKSYALILGRAYFDLSLPFSQSFVSYDTRRENYKIQLNDSFTLPIALAMEEDLEYNLISASISDAVAEECMTVGAKRDLQKNIRGDIVSFGTRFIKDKNLAILDSNSECLETIGIEENANGGEADQSGTN